ncbi:MAG: MCE family protein [Nostocoides sp.]
MSIPFRERNPIPIGVVGLVVIAILLLLAFNASSLPIIGGGPTYAADFSEAGGLKPDDDVRIAGVKVGTVQSVDLAGDHVRVGFRIRGSVAFGPETSASVRMRTLLGSMYLSLEPRGSGQLKEHSTIPISRTLSSYDIVDAFSELTRTTEKIDTHQLATSLDVLATEFKDSPANVKAALAGLTRLSRTISGRDDELHRLLADANSVTTTIAERNKVIDTLIKDADLLLVELNARRDAIHTLFVNTSAMAQQITGLVRDNRAALQPALDQVNGVLSTLQKHEADLTKTIDAMAPFTRLFANVLGTGRWFDTYIQNLTNPIGTVGK